MKNKDNSPENYEIGEDATEYGEFMSSYFAWLPLPVQKEKAEKFDDISKKRKKK